MKIKRISKIRSFSLQMIILMSVLIATGLFSQDQIMPVGNSITWGKVNNDPPPAGEEGYRKYLYNLLDGDAVNFPGGVTFVGDSGTYAGHFADRAQIGWFLHADSTKGDISATIDVYQPNIVLLHIGTNDVGTGIPIGNAGQNGSIMYKMNQMIDKIIGNSHIDQLLVCKIIPKLRTPGEQAETQNFNNALEILVDQKGSPKIKLIDMWTPFNEKQNEYYNLSVDSVHLNTNGYQKMAEIFYQNLKAGTEFTDEFDRTSIGSDWEVGNGMGIFNTGENNGGALTFTSFGNSNWDNLAVWKTSKNLTTVSLKIDELTPAAALSHVGVAVGLDTLDTLANGYLIWYRGDKNAFFVKSIVNGNANLGSDVTNSNGLGPVTVLPGDEIKVGFIQGDSDNRFTISIPNREGTPSFSVSDQNQYAGNTDSIYAGIMFHGHTTTPWNVYVDAFTVISGGPDNVPPGAPSQLRAFNASKTSVIMSWYAPGNDGYAENTKAASYDLRYSTSSIRDVNLDPQLSDWKNATIISNLPLPGVKDTYHSMEVTGLAPGTRYYFRIRATDEWGNQSELSTEVSFRTKDASFVWDRFARDEDPATGSIGLDWSIDPNEYRIDYNNGIPEESNFENYQIDGAWGRVATYTAITNPYIVKLVWGQGATQDGIFQGGVALQLDNPTINASGYLLFIRSTVWADRVYLYEIDNGYVDPDKKVAEVAYTYDRLPQAGDTMTVNIDKFDPNGLKFDVRINSSPASDQPLYDPDRLHNPATSYAGIMLGRRNGQNPVNAFGLSAEPCDIEELDIVSGDDLIGTVGETLTDSLVVKALDCNNGPVPFWPVWFWVVEPPDASVVSPPLMTDPILFEAEWDYNPEGNYSVYDDELASEDKYMNAPSGGAGAGQLEYPIYIDQAETYYFWGRIIATSLSNMAVQVEINGNTWNWNCNYYGGSNQFSTSWRWDRIRPDSNPDTPIAVNLNPGEYTFKITKLHDNVKIDKFMITSDASKVPTLEMPVDLLKTDKYGIAKTEVTLGETSGINRIRARAFGSGNTPEFLLTGAAGVPDSIVTSNRTQSGCARNALPQPFQVRLFDNKGNAVPNIPVHFTLTQGDGTLSATIDTTDANGTASTVLTLGIGVVNQIVTATVPGTSLPVEEFYGNVVCGLPNRIESLISTSATRHYVGDQLNNFLKVKVFDDQNSPMDGVPVYFSASDDSTTFGKTKLTNAQGIVTDTLFIGSQTGILNITARTGSVQQVVFTDSIFNYATKMIQMSAFGGLRVGINDTSQIPVKVRVYNGTQYAPNHPVKFKAYNGFRFPGKAVGDSVWVNTASNGIASTYVVAGATHGKYDEAIEASATNGFYHLKYSPMDFSMTAVSDASRLEYVGGNNQTGVVEEELPQPMQVRMVKINGEPVEGQPVTFNLIQGDGRFTETLLDEYTATTNGYGIAEAFFKLGVKAGAANVNIVDALATTGDPNEPLGNTPIRFYLNARSSKADSIYTVSDDSTSGIVGRPLADNVQVFVGDSKGNPVIDAPVKFSVITPGGALDETADTTKIVRVPQADGIAEVSWTLGKEVGTYNHILQVSALDDDNKHLNGSPLMIYASGEPDSVSSISSAITTNSPKNATGTDSCTITVTLLDRYQNPIAGKWVKLDISPKTQSFHTSQIGPTDANGQAVGYLVSTLAGIKTITATVMTDNIVLQNRAEAVFLADAAAKIEKVTTGTLQGNAGTVYIDSLVVRITDENSNPVAFGPVQFYVSGGGGSIIGDPTVVSDSQGYASAYVALGPSAGDNVYEVSASKFNGTPLQGSPVTFLVKGVQGVPVSMHRVSAPSITGEAGVLMHDALAVGVIDAVGNPVGNVSVSYSVQQGGSQIISSMPVKTDMYGHAKISFKPDTTAGQENLILASASLSNSPLLFTVQSVPSFAYQLVHVSGNGQSAQVGTTMSTSLMARVTDKYGNPVAGKKVTFEVVSGTASLNGSQSVMDTSNAQGYVSVPLTLGNATGNVLVRATGTYLVGSPIDFLVYAYTANAVNIRRYPVGDTSTLIGRKGAQLMDPLRVQVIDAYNNPVPNVSVLFAVTSGSGQIVESAPVPSDVNGICSAHFICPNSTGTSKVKALWLDKEVEFTIQTVNNPNVPSLNTSVWNSPYSVFEGQQLQITIAANADADGDPLSFDLANTVPPAGIQVLKQSSVTAILKWTPGFDQQGTYVLHIRVHDGRGGYDVDSVTVYVNDYNFPPVISRYAPVKKDTSMLSCISQRFWIEATDPDGDALHYSWTADGVTEGGDSPLLEMKTDNYFTGTMSVKVTVTDGLKSVRFEWQPEYFFDPSDSACYEVSIEEADVQTYFDIWNHKISLKWTPSEEANNLGFHVYRSQTRDGNYKQLTEEIIPTNTKHEYRFDDSGVASGTKYFYRIESQDSHGYTYSYGPFIAQAPLPDHFELFQNYPNPFNPTTKIRFQMPHKAHVKLVVYNMMGQVVQTMIDEEREPGFHTAIWNGLNQNGQMTATGIYIYRLSTPSHTFTKRMVKLH